MKEAEWLASEDPQAMLRSLNMRWRAQAYRKGTRVNFQRFRLFACACCRRIVDLLDERGAQAIAQLEAYVRRPDRKEFLAIRRGLTRIYQDAYQQYFLPNSRSGRDEEGHYLAYLALRAAGEMKPSVAATKSSIYAAGAVAGRERIRGKPAAGYTFRIAPAEFAAQAELLRHIAGNPFSPLPGLVALPQVVTRLAEAVEAGEDCAFALADALEETGHPEFADHFRETGTHPRSCAWLDALLGRS